MSSLARQYAGLKKVKSKVFKPSRLEGELPAEWLRSKARVTIDGNNFVETNLNSDDTLLLMRHSRLFHVREEAMKEAREQQLNLLQALEKEDKIQKVPQKWETYINDLKRGSQAKAELEYNQLARWKLRTEELRPDRDVFPYDYLWLMYALRCKMCAIESFTRQYFPVAAVVQGIRKLAEKLLQVKDTPADEDYYLNLCPWITTNERVVGYPRCVTPAQAWQIFRAAGHDLSLKAKERKDDLLLSAPFMYGFLFERFASHPAFVAEYSNHWSRVELTPAAPRAPLPGQYLKQVSRSYRSFPAFRAQQAWWYSQPDRLREESLEEGVYFYPVPSVRHTLQAGLPTLRKSMSELAVTMLWNAVIPPDSDLDLTSDDTYDIFISAVEELGAENVHAEALEKVVSELRGVDTPLLAAPDLTKFAPALPNEYYNETYRPILRYEIDHAAENGIDLPDWYLRRRRELATGPHSQLVGDLSRTVSGDVLDFASEMEMEAEVEARQQKEKEAAEEKRRAEEDDVVYRDASEDESLPLAERLRLARLQASIQTHNDSGIDAVMSARSVDNTFRPVEEQMERKHTRAQRLRSSSTEEE